MYFLSFLCIAAAGSNFFLTASRRPRRSRLCWSFWWTPPTCCWTPRGGMVVPASPSLAGITRKSPLPPEQESREGVDSVRQSSSPRTPAPTAWCGPACCPRGGTTPCWSGGAFSATEDSRTCAGFQWSRWSQLWLSQNQLFPPKAATSVWSPKCV